jgi:hypothetical protein
MKVGLITALGCILLVTAAWSQEKVQPGSEPSPMEAFALAQGTRASWSGTSITVENGGTRVLLTPLILEDNAQPARQVRGLKVELSNTGAHDLIYLDETAVTRTRSALQEIADAVTRSGVRGNGCEGAREFWPGYNWAWNKYHELNVDFCGGSDLVLYGRGKEGAYRLPGNDPTQLAVLLTKAMDELQQH